MQSEFAALDKMLSGAVDSTFGISFRLIPYVSTNLGSKRDATRPPYVATGTFIELAPEQRSLAGDRRPSDWQNTVSGQLLKITFDRANLVGFVPKGGDVAEVVGAVPARRYILSEPSADGEARLSYEGTPA